MRQRDWWLLGLAVRFAQWTDRVEMTSFMRAALARRHLGAFDANVTRVLWRGHRYDWKLTKRWRPR